MVKRVAAPDWIPCDRIATMSTKGGHGPEPGQPSGELWLHWKRPVIEVPVGTDPDWGLVLENPTDRVIAWDGGVLVVEGTLQEVPSDRTVNTLGLRTGVLAIAIKHSLSPGDVREIGVSLPIAEADLARLAVGRYKLAIRPAFLMQVIAEVPEPLTLRVYEFDGPQL